MSDDSLTHPVHLVLMVCCMLILGFAISPWFWLMSAVFLVVWGVRFLGWVFEGCNGKL